MKKAVRRDLFRAGMTEPGGGEKAALCVPRVVEPECAARNRYGLTSRYADELACPPMLTTTGW